LYIKEYFMIKKEDRYKEWYDLKERFEKYFPNMYIFGLDPGFMIRYRNDELSQTIFISRRFMETILEKIDGKKE